MNIKDINIDHLRQFISSKIREKQTVEDLVQESIYKTLHYAQRQNIVNWQGFLFTVAHNLVKDHFLNQQKQRNKPCSGHNTIVEEPCYERQVDSLIIHNALLYLPPRYQEIVYQVDILGKSQIGLAQDYQLSVSGLKSRVQRGRKLLKDIIEECMYLELDKYGNILDYYNRYEDCKLI